MSKGRTVFHDIRTIIQYDIYVRIDRSISCECILKVENERFGSVHVVHNYFCCLLEKKKEKTNGWGRSNFFSPISKKHQYKRRKKRDRLGQVLLAQERKCVFCFF